MVNKVEFEDKHSTTYWAPAADTHGIESLADLGIGGLADLGIEGLVALDTEGLVVLGIEGLAALDTGY
jgi:hypothetical protein